MEFTVESYKIIEHCAAHEMGHFLCDRKISGNSFSPINPPTIKILFFHKPDDSYNVHAIYQHDVLKEFIPQVLSGGPAMDLLRHVFTPVFDKTNEGSDLNRLLEYYQSEEVVIKEVETKAKCFEERDLMIVQRFIDQVLEELDKMSPEDFYEGIRLLTFDMSDYWTSY